MKHLVCDHRKICAVETCAFYKEWPLEGEGILYCPLWETIVKGVEVEKEKPKPTPDWQERAVDNNLGNVLYWVSHGYILTAEQRNTVERIREFCKRT